MKTKTLILAIFGLLALANAGGRRQKTPYKEDPPPEKAYADPGYEQRAYAYPGYQQPTAKYVQFKLNYSGISCYILFA